MRWYSTFSNRADTTDAAREVCDALRADLGDATPDLVLAFYSASHVPSAESLARTLKMRLSPRCLAGASANGIVSSAHEVESGPALTVMAAVLPGIALHPFLLANEIWEEAWQDPAAFAQAAPGARGAEVVVVLGDPFSLDIQRVVAAFNRHAPTVRLAGGMASAATRPGGNALFLNDWVSHEGGFALAFHGAIRADVVVSQGCRPIGPPLEITRADGNLVLELDGQPALERAEQVLRELPEDERERLQSGLYVGRPARGDATGRGDYLIRNLLGADRDRGVMAIGDVAIERERVRLHVRDRETAREDLEMLLSPQAFDARAGAALLFACNGRGTGLFGEPDGDIATLQAMLGGPIPAGGMFCAGEIGPVGERNHLHGHAASIAILRAGARS
jgi:small ligand-binding sensory domain FIST